MHLPQRPTDQDNEYVFEVEDFTAPPWLGYVLVGGALMWGGFLIALIAWAL